MPVAEEAVAWLLMSPAAVLVVTPAATQAGRLDLMLDSDCRQQ